MNRYQVVFLVARSADSSRSRRGCRETILLSRPASEYRAPLDHNSRRVREDRGKRFCLPHQGSYRLGTSRCTIARHCRPCRTNRSHWREGADGGSTNKAIFSTVSNREYSLPGIRHVFSVRSKLVAPDKPLTLKAAASCVFPFRLAREPFPGPLRIGDGIVFWMPPVRAGNPSPPSR